MDGRCWAQEHALLRELRGGRHDSKKAEIFMLNRCNIYLYIYYIYILYNIIYNNNVPLAL